MTYTTFMDVGFDPADYAGADTAAKQAAVHAYAQKFFGFYNGGSVADVLDPSSPNTLASPEVVFDGADSYLRGVISAAPVEVQGAFANKVAMDADLDATDGQLVNCFDPDGTTPKRGRYSKSGGSGSGSWGRVGDIADRLWWDPNHPKLGLGLMPFGSWIDTSPPFPLRGSQAAYTSPPSDDWTNARVTFTVRAKSLKKTPLTKLALHMQGDVAARTASLPQVHGSGNYFVPNFYNRAQLLSDALGFNQPNSWGVADLRETVEDSGWVDWVVDFTPDDLDWQSMGGVPRTLAASPYYYGICPVAELLAEMTGNLYWLALYPREPASESAYFTPTTPGGVGDEISGEIWLKRIKCEYFTP